MHMLTLAGGEKERENPKARGGGRLGGVRYAVGTLDCQPSRMWVLLVVVVFLVRSTRKDEGRPVPSSAGQGATDDHFGKL
jgi:hypothetical protein